MGSNPATCSPPPEWPETARRRHLWLDCLSYRQVSDEIRIDDKTVAAWCAEKSNELGNSAPHGTNDKPWGVVQHFDVWSFQNGGDDSSYFGRMPPTVVENLLWLYTEPGDIVVDLAIGPETLRLVWTGHQRFRLLWDLERGFRAVPLIFTSPIRSVSQVSGSILFGSNSSFDGRA